VLSNIEVETTIHVHGHIAFYGKRALFRRQLEEIGLWIPCQKLRKGIADRCATSLDVLSAVAGASARAGTAGLRRVRARDGQRGGFVEAR
jgi:hypothetical protein